MFHRVPKCAWAIVVCAVFAVPAVGQVVTNTPDTTGWFHIGQLRDGQPITVSTGSRFPIHCIFRGITDHSLRCDQGAFLIGLNQREIARDQVAWLRTDNAPRDRAIMVGTTGGAGAVLGALTTGTGSTRAVGALLGGSLGMGVGAIAFIPLALSMPGKTIYIQPGPPSDTHPTHLHWPALKKRPAQPTDLAQSQ
jgi:hypothetical protein